MSARDGRADIEIALLVEAQRKYRRKTCEVVAAADDDIVLHPTTDGVKAEHSRADVISGTSAKTKIPASVA